MLPIGDFIFEVINKRHLPRVIEFLRKQELTYDEGCEFTIAFKYGEKIAATGSFEGKVLKCIAVSPEFEGAGLAASVLSELINEEYARGRSHLFLYTKPANRIIFENLGFYEIGRAEGKALLMENRPDGISRFLDSLEKPDLKEGDSIGCVVANCNPFTKGHLHLIEYAADRSSHLHLFILGEDKSFFSTETRLSLVKEGVSRIPNISIHLARDYMISNATFPSYFLKNKSEAAEIHAELDLNIFGRHIAPRLNITRRFAGEEPFSLTTAVYNKKMAEILPAFGIDFITIPRLSVGETIVSATTVRSCLKNRDMEKLKALVPESTYRYLQTCSEESK